MDRGRSLVTRNNIYLRSIPFPRYSGRSEDPGVREAHVRADCSPSGTPASKRVRDRIGRLWSRNAIFVVALVLYGMMLIAVLRGYGYWAVVPGLGAVICANVGRVAMEYRDMLDDPVSGDAGHPPGRRR